MIVYSEHQSIALTYVGIMRDLNSHLIDMLHGTKVGTALYEDALEVDRLLSIVRDELDDLSPLPCCPK